VYHLKNLENDYDAYRVGKGPYKYLANVNMKNGMITIDSILDKIILANVVKNESAKNGVVKLKNQLHEAIKLSLSQVGNFESMSKMNEQDIRKNVKDVQETVTSTGNKLNSDKSVITFVEPGEYKDTNGKTYTVKLINTGRGGMGKVVTYGGNDKVVGVLKRDDDTGGNYFLQIKDIKDDGTSNIYLRLYKVDGGTFTGGGKISYIFHQAILNSIKEIFPKEITDVSSLIYNEGTGHITKIINH
jgi:hypothetical protein